VTFSSCSARAAPYGGQNIQIIYAILTQQPMLPDLNAIPPEI
jgi:hypothetical protein